MYCLAPSILAADFKQLGQQVKEVEEAGAQYIHIDVMDGAFVPSISFGMPVIKSLRSGSSAIFDVHLMIEEPGRYIDDFVACGADIITVHAEACKHLDRIIDQVKEKGIKVGISLNPATPIACLEHVIEKVDMILIMSVNPGFGGQKYIPYCTTKIKELRTWLTQKGLKTDIQVDGGIHLLNVRTVLDAGANIIVAGSAVFNGKESENVAAFLDVFRGYEEQKA